MSTVKLLVSDIASEVKALPSHYIRPMSDRPNFSNVENSDGSSIPLIDLDQLLGSGRSGVIEEISFACKYDGFFQV